MFKLNRFNKDQSGQTALEAAIILIAFIVVASLFAFAILSAGTSSTEEAEEAIYAGLSGVTSSLQVRGAVVAEEGVDATPADASDDIVKTMRFTVSLSSGGQAVDLTSGATSRVLIGFRTSTILVNNVTWSASFLGNSDSDMLLEDGELAEILVTMPTGADALKAATQFTLEVKPPTGGVLDITRTTPAAIEAVMELR